MKTKLEAEEKYAVLGNHDYWCGRAGDLVAMLKDLGFKVLRDESADTKIGRYLESIGEMIEIIQAASGGSDPDA